jgi:hypothetical protein
MSKVLLVVLLAGSLFAGELKVGNPLTAKRTVSLTDLVAKPERYVGKTFRVEGKITEVCQVMGCWVMLTDGKGAMMRIQMEEGKVAFPKDAAGRSVVAEGKLARYQLSKEQAIAEAKHAAEDAGRPFHPESVKGPAVIYQIEGTGAVLLD